MTSAEQTQQKIVEQLERTNRLIQRIENQRYLQMVDRPFKFLWMSFLQGVAIALGSTLGLAVVLAVIVYILNKLQVFTPLNDYLNTIKDLLQNIKK